MNPTPEWGPALPENRTGRYAPLNATPMNTLPTIVQYDASAPVNKVSPITPGYVPATTVPPPPSYSEYTAETEKEREISHL